MSIKDGERHRGAGSQNSDTNQTYKITGIPGSPNNVWKDSYELVGDVKIVDGWHDTVRILKDVCSYEPASGVVLEEGQLLSIGDVVTIKPIPHGDRKNMSHVTVPEKIIYRGGKKIGEIGASISKKGDGIKG